MVKQTQWQGCGRRKFFSQPDCTQSNNFHSDTVLQADEFTLCAHYIKLYVSFSYYLTPPFLHLLISLVWSSVFFFYYFVLGLLFLSPIPILLKCPDKHYREFRVSKAIHARCLLQLQSSLRSKQTRSYNLNSGQFFVFWSVTGVWGSVTKKKLLHFSWEKATT